MHHLTCVAIYVHLSSCTIVIMVFACPVCGDCQSQCLLPLCNWCRLPPSPVGHHQLQKEDKTMAQAPWNLLWINQWSFQGRERTRKYMNWELLAAFLFFFFFLAIGQGQFKNGNKEKLKPTENGYRVLMMLFEFLEWSLFWRPLPCASQFPAPSLYICFFFFLLKTFWVEYF